MAEKHIQIGPNGPDDPREHQFAAHLRASFTERLDKPRKCRVLKRDVLEELNEAMLNQMRPGTANSDINVFDLDYPIKYGLLVRLRNEIVRLRSRG